ncbi:alpha-1-antitrypsin-like [Ambystoma mexicanum]|uniref:alpha-1-antitrypsin-like n=1 Tax=Ambystoma mexicanum TaxID=8296 RepID=UPI0037E7E322
MGALLFFACALIAVACGDHVDHHVDHHVEHHVEHHVHKPEPAHKEDHAGNMTCPHIVSANMNFAFNLYRHCASESPSKNIYFSPASIGHSFAMLALGAKTTTRQQIMKGLSFNLTDDKEEEVHKGFENLLDTLAKKKSELTVNIGNAIFLDKHLQVHQQFKDEAIKHYHAEVCASNFSSPEEAKKQINDYVEKKTEGKIVDLIKDLNKDTQIGLVNYILFKGKWQRPFQSRSTTTQNFTQDDGTTVRVPMMTQTKVHQVLFDTVLPCSVIQLPYMGDASMMIVLPQPGKMKVVEDALSEETFTRWKKQSKESFVELWLPKFSISPSMNLKEAMIALGITDVFDHRANLSGIAAGPPLKLDKADHKAVLEVNEEGTESAASTFFEGVPMALFPEFRANHPFLTIISTNDNYILFVGKVTKPLEK